MKLSSIPSIALVLLMTLPMGCARLPKRDPGVHFGFFPDSPPPLSENPAIPSDYLDLANEQPDENHLMLLEVGDDALLARIHLIRAATEQIDIQTFIWKDDEVTRVLYHELLEAARRGVNVRILVDALNPVSGNTRLAEMALAHPKLEFALFRPVSYYTQPGTITKLESMILKMRRLNRRMHNKLFLVDGKVGIIGGRNFENKYFDRSPVMIFKDRDVVVTGPTTLSMNHMFEAFWEHKDSVYLTQFKDVQARVSSIPERPYTVLKAEDPSTMEEMLKTANLPDPGISRPQMAFTKVKEAAFYWDPPGKFKRGKQSYENHYGEMIQEAFSRARKRILIQSPYLIYQSKTKKVIKAMRKENPGLEIWFSTNSLAAADHDVVYGVSFKDRKNLYKGLGLEIFEFMPIPHDLLFYVPRYPVLSGLSEESLRKHVEEGTQLEVLLQGPKVTIHAKSFIIDDTYSQIGSHNFDPRSSSLNTECGLIIKDKEFTKILSAHIHRDIAPQNSWIVGKRNEKESLLSRMSGFVGAISNMLPIFDIWPYTYTSNFELREGFDPLSSSRHPDFYKHYKDVGQFPLVVKAIGKMRVKFMKSFAGWTSPLM